MSFESDSDSVFLHESFDNGVNVNFLQIFTEEDPDTRHIIQLLCADYLISNITDERRKILMHPNCIDREAVHELRIFDLTASMKTKIKLYASLIWIFGPNADKVVVVDNKDTTFFFGRNEHNCLRRNPGSVTASPSPRKKLSSSRSPSKSPSKSPKPLEDVGEASTSDSQGPNLDKVEAMAIRIPELSGIGIKGICSGDFHSVAYSETKAYFWGSNVQFEFNTFATELFKPLPCKPDLVIPDGDGIRKVNCGKYHTVILTNKGELYGYRTHYYEDVGEYVPGNRRTRQHSQQKYGKLSDDFRRNVTNFSQVYDIACTATATFVLFEFGSGSQTQCQNCEVYGWGLRRHYQLCRAHDNRSRGYITKPTKIGATPDGAPIIKISAADTYVMALTNEGKLCIWGTLRLNNNPAGTQVFEIPTWYGNPKPVAPGDIPIIVNMAAVFSTNVSAIMDSYGKIYVIGLDQNPVAMEPDNLSFPYVFLQKANPARTHQTIRFRPLELESPSKSPTKKPPSKPESDDSKDESSDKKIATDFKPLSVK